MSNCSLKRDESVLKENSIAAEINNQDTNRSMISCRCSEESRNHLNRTTHIVKLDDSMVRATRSDHSEGGGGQKSVTGGGLKAANRHSKNRCSKNHTVSSQQSSYSKREKKSTTSSVRKEDMVFESKSHKKGVITCQRCLKKLARVDSLHKRGASRLGEQRSRSSQDLQMRTVMSLKDLPKYDTKLKGKKDDRLSKSMSSQRMPTLTDRVKKIEKDHREMMDKNRWEFLRNQCILQQSDWLKSNLYKSFLKNGRQLLKETSTESGIAVDSVYTETELRY